MATINLLPWRDEYRQEKKREFFSVLILLIILAGLVGFVWMTYVEAQVSDQRSRNTLFNKEIAVLDKKVKEIQGLKKQRDSLESKIEIIQGLQTKRPLIVHYFDELVYAVPDGIYFTGLSRKGSNFSVKGNSESNNRVSTLMRNLDRSKFFASPNLKNVVQESFDLSVKAVTPPDLGRE